MFFRASSIILFALFRASRSHAGYSKKTRTLIPGRTRHRLSSASSHCAFFSPFSLKKTPSCCCCSSPLRPMNDRNGTPPYLPFSLFPPVLLYGSHESHQTLICIQN
ncbi:hypothetical protein ABB37_05006 [Leptomonas pyrrhocoris]|uniref:Secreted protein n=1 Tax=Leptomonas pyrrhocoris TaxID=157538 RepID=A0A0M9G0Y9_LEPPY|nr:hypothetical protein ABB37_05006 [Leptomonas pyrrhocoris]KPA79959.1 hypothetical protein ABB37_05006 [Leptomonas pyrrhocoris]|eukprot:XP_015658398.1 hypothetical protein ABB37_05006 [Leptomonas pyrrhocoris]